MVEGKTHYGWGRGPPHGETPESVKRQRECDTVARNFIVVPARRNNWARVADLGLPGLNNVSWLWSVGVVWYSVLDWLGQGDSGPGIRAPKKKWLEYGLWVSGLHRKGRLSKKLFDLSRNWLALGGAVSPGSASPWGVKASKIQNKETRLISTMWDIQAVWINMGIKENAVCRDFKSQHCTYLWCEFS